MAPTYRCESRGGAIRSIAGHHDGSELLAFARREKNGRVPSRMVAIAPETGEAFGLVLPKTKTATMSIYLAEFARTLAENVQAVLVLDQAGWHGAKELGVPANITLTALQPETQPSRKALSLSA